MRNHRFLSHTSEAALLAEADSLDELFRAALEGMNQLLSHAIPSTETRTDEIELRAADTTSLLIDFLSDALTRSHINRVVYFAADFAELDAETLRATLHGAAVAQFDEDVKAVTHHGAQVRCNTSGHWETEVIFDI